jgi:hypothetical protein
VVPAKLSDCHIAFIQVFFSLFCKVNANFAVCFKHLFNTVASRGVGQKRNVPG